MTIKLIAEGLIDEFVASRLLLYCGHELVTVYGRKGCKYIKDNAYKFYHYAMVTT